MKFICLLFFSVCYLSCGYVGAGSLGAWKIKVFPLTERRITVYIDSLIQENPQYRVPKKWSYDAGYWSRTGFDVSKIKLFYFKSGPEEMYFVSFLEPGLVENPSYARIAIRSVFTQRMGWREIKKHSTEEKIRIEERFNNEIISKLESLTGKIAYEEKTFP